MVAVDVDGDSDVDVVAASLKDDTVAWSATPRGPFRRGASSRNSAPIVKVVIDRRPRRFESDAATPPAFAERVIAENADGAFAVYARDLDADGDEDILVASGRDDSITFFENDSDESFTDRVITSAADNARAVYADDVDGDGSIDVLSGSEDDDTVAWWKNDGSQVFTEAIITTLRNQPQCVKTADVAGNGIRDVLVASSNDNTVGFAAPSSSFLARFFGGLATDADGSAARDGRADVRCARDAAPPAQVAWYENDGDESFAERVVDSGSTSNKAYSITGEDIDGDGDVDLLSAAAGVDTVAAWINDGSETFARTDISTSGDGANTVFVSDVDSDNDFDALSASWNDNSVWFHENACGTSAPTTSSPTGVPSSVPSALPTPAPVVPTPRPSTYVGRAE